MPIIESKIDTNSAEFSSNREAMLEEIAAFRAIEQKVRDAEEQRRQRYHDRGQLLPNERVALLLDRGSPFLELSTLCGYKMHDDKDGSAAGGNTIIGIGYVSGVRCLIMAHNSAIKGGTISPMGLHKSLRGQDIAYQNKLPVINLVESGGANLLYQAEVFVPGGRIFANQARTSAAGIPQVCVVHGSSTAGGAYAPGLSDHVIMVRGRAKVFLAGPPLLKAATGEIADDEELGGAEMHAQMAGTTEYLAEDDDDGVRIAREVVSKLGWNEQYQAPLAENVKPPRYDIEELCGAVPTDYRKPYDCREVIARLVDDSDFQEFKNPFDQQTVCGRALIEGHTVGIISNNGPITPQGAVKAAQFIQLCDQSNTPLVFLQNTTGFMVGTRAEQNGIVKHGSKMIQAVANCRVPKLTIVMGGSFGAGNYGMCGRGFDPRFIFAWPTARTSVMGGEQAGGVMAIVTEQKMAKRGQEAPPEFLAQMKEKIKQQFDAEGHAHAATARLFDDGIIDPRDTRKLLGFLLSVVNEAEQRPVYPSSYGVARM